MYREAIVVQEPVMRSHMVLHAFVQGVRRYWIWRIYNAILERPSDAVLDDHGAGTAVQNRGRGFVVHSEGKEGREIFEVNYGTLIPAGVAASTQLLDGQPKIRASHFVDICVT